MITGNGSDNKGRLSLTINNNVKFTLKTFHKNDKVINECYSSLDSIVLQNDGWDNNAWAGQLKVIRYEENSGEWKKVDLKCTSGCTNNNHLWNDKVVVDGNADSSNLAPKSTWCFNGQHCVFEPEGITRYQRW